MEFLTVSEDAEYDVSLTIDIAELSSQSGYKQCTIRRQLKRNTL